MKRTLKLAGWSILILAAAGLLFQRIRGGMAAPVKKPVATLVTAASEKPGAAVKARPAEDAMRVNAWIVQPSALAETVAATGTLRAEESVDLQAEVSGKIVSINFREGSRVRKGDVLIKINDSELAATLDRANAKLELARQREARFSKLAAVGGINEQDFDAVQSELSVQKAEVDLIKAQISKTELRAPFDGMIGLRFVSEGAYITATSNNAVRIATLQSIDNLKVDFSVPEKYAGRVHIGGSITFMVAGYEQRFRGEVYAYEPRIDVNTRTLLIRALCPNSAIALVPGSFATVEMKLNEVSDAIVVPAAAVIPGLTEKNVFVVVGGKAVRRAVQTGTRTESAVQIVGGLKTGDVLVTSGLQQLRNGQNVRAVYPSAPVVTAGAVAVGLQDSSAGAAGAQVH